MDRAPSLKANFVWQFLTNGLAAVSQLVIVLTLAKLTSKGINGEFIYAWALCTPLFMFAGLDLRAVQATDARNEFSFADQFAIRLLTGLMATVIALSVVLWLNRPGTLLWVVAAVSCGKYFELVAETFVGFMQQRERFDLVTRSTAIRAFVSCSSLTLAIIATRDLTTSVMIWAACGLVNLALVEVPWGKQFLKGVQDQHVADSTQPTAEPLPSLWRQRITQTGMEKLLTLGFPLAIRSLLVSLTPSVARFFVEGYWGMSELGPFGTISQLTMAAILFSRTLNPAVAPRLSRYLRDGNLAAFRMLLVQLRLFYAVLGIASVLTVLAFGPFILSLIKPAYVGYHSVFVWAMVATAMLFQGGVLDMSLVTLRRVDSLAKTSVLTLGTMSLSGWLLVPRLGLEGASISMALSWMIRGLYLQYVLSSALKDVEQRLAAEPPSITDDKSVEASGSPVTRAVA